VAWLAGTFPKARPSIEYQLSEATALALAASPTICATLIIWLFVMRSLMIVTSLVSYFGNEMLSKAMFGGKKDFVSELHFQSWFRFTQKPGAKARMTATARWRSATAFNSGSRSGDGD
jgi:hypothetical protein